MSIRAYKYRLYPTKNQTETLNRFFGCARKVYNLCLAWYIDAYNAYKSDGTPIGKQPDYTHFRNMPEYAFLKECDSVALQQARRHFDEALEAFLKSRKGERKGRKAGFPKFKKKGAAKDTYTTFNNGGCIKLSSDGKRIKLPKVGMVRIVLHRPFAGTIRSANVSRSRSGKYHISLTVETGQPEKPLFNRVPRVSKPSVAGLDMSMEGFAVSSDPSDVTKPKYVREYRRNERRLSRLQRMLSRKAFTGTGEYRTDSSGKEVEIRRPSKNREKARLRYAKACEKLANRRREFCIQTALHYVRKYDAVVLEDIDLQSMSKSLRLGKSVNDLAFGEFRRWLEHEAGKYDCYIHYVDRFFPSSKLCSGCGWKNDSLSLSDREWTCPECGCHHDRDVNAAINLRDEFLTRYNTAGTAGIQACGDGSSTLRETVGRLLSQDPFEGRKQEAVRLGVVGIGDACDFSRG